MKQNLQKNNITQLMLIAGSVVVSLSGLVGCNNSQQPNSSGASAPSVTPGQSVQKAAVQKQVSSVLKISPAPVNQFDFSTKKDPFKPFAIIKTPVSSSSNNKELKTVLPIHSFDISQFKLIGIVTGGKENKAMVTDPNGKGYVLRTGMTIGKNDGKITAITNNGVEVLEQFRDDNGRVRKEHIKITLPRKQ